MRPFITCLVVACVALLSGCSESDPGASETSTVGTSEPAAGETTPAPPVETTTAAAAVETVDTLAAKLGCTPEPVEKMIAQAAVKCDVGGKSIEIATFATNQQRDQYAQMGKGAVPGLYLVQGDLWLAGGDGVTAEDLEPLNGEPVS